MGLWLSNHHGILKLPFLFFFKYFSCLPTPNPISVHLWRFFFLPCSSERVNPFWFIPEQPSSSAPVRACWLGVQKISHLWGQAVVFHLASKLNWKRKFLFFLKRVKITMLCKGIRLIWSSRECQHAEFQVKIWLFSKAFVFKHRARCLGSVLWR